MLPTFTSPALYTSLAHLARSGPVARQLAYFGAGLLSMFFVRPPLPQAKPVNFALQSIIALLLFWVFVLLLGDLLILLQPVLVAIGGLTLERVIVGTVMLFLAWRYLRGRNLLRAFMAYQDVSSGAIRA